MSYTFFTLERDAELAILTLNHGKANVFTVPMHQELQGILDTLNADDSVLGLIITGRDKFFSAGANIADMVNYGVKEGTEFAEAGQTTANKLERSRFLTLMAVNGFAFGGGCEMGLAADMRVCAETAVFGQPEINIGVIPGWGGSRRLQRIVGRTKAFEMILTGEPINAAEAYRVGLVNAVHPVASLLDEAKKLARKVTSKGPTAIESCKRAMLAGQFLSDEQAEAVERELFGKAFATADRKEGMGAFIEKRPAAFPRQFPAK